MLNQVIENIKSAGYNVSTIEWYVNSFNGIVINEQCFLKIYEWKGKVTLYGMCDKSLNQTYSLYSSDLNLTEKSNEKRIKMVIDNAILKTKEALEKLLAENDRKTKCFQEAKVFAEYAAKKLNGRCSFSEHNQTFNVYGDLDLYVHVNNAHVEIKSYMSIDEFKKLLERLGE
jgi:hypothetical protein